MRDSYQILSATTLFLPLLLGVLSWVTWQRYQERAFRNLTELWASLFVNAVFLVWMGPDISRLAGIEMLGWIWPVRTLLLILEDISGKKLMPHRWYFISMGVAAFISFAMGGYGLPFVYYSLPFSLALGGIGLFLLKKGFHETSRKEFSPLYLAVFIFAGIYYVRRLTYPIWGVNEAVVPYFIGLEILCLSGLGGASIATYIDLFKGKRESEMEKELNERSEKFFGHSKFSELGMMSAGIAHEINNPLAVIQARTTQLLRIYKNPEKQKDLGDGLQQILYTSERINKTIQGVREFVHQDERAPLTEVNLKELFDNVLSFTGQRMKNHGISLRLYGLENFSVMCHKVQLEQVMLNLINNSFDAIEFLPDKWIEVSCHEKDGKVQIYFKDSGKGIPKEIAERIMEPFFSTKDIGKGTGLGLALARGIVEKHGGSLTYLSNCPHTTFLLEVPKVQGQEWGIPLH